MNVESWIEKSKLSHWNL